MKKGDVVYSSGQGKTEKWNQVKGIITKVEKDKISFGRELTHVPIRYVGIHMRPEQWIRTKIQFKLIQMKFGIKLRIFV